MQKTSILTVCLGNICRSPLAEGILRHLAEQRGLSSSLEIDSCGTSSYHVGERPHRGSQQIARERGVSLDGIRSRQIEDADFERFDWFLCMDTDNRNTVRHLARDQELEDRVVLLLDYARGDGPRDVPDPYYEGGFPGVFDLIYDGCEGFLDHLASK